MDQIISVISGQLTKIPLTRSEKDICLRAISFEKFRQISIWIDAGGYFGIALSREEVSNGEWCFFWVYPHDPSAPDWGGYHNVHYKLRSGGELAQTRDE